jgi:hypothetical protein
VIGGPGAFIIVANGFKDFAQAIRRKLILEITGILPAFSPHPELYHECDKIRAIGQAQTQSDAAPIRPAGKDRCVPPCNEGEIHFRGVIDDE